MNFWEALQAMDEGKTVQMVLNPVRRYRLAKDGTTIVCQPIYPEGPFLNGEEWVSAAFFSRHIRGEWMVVG